MMDFPETRRVFSSYTLISTAEGFLPGLDTKPFHLEPLWLVAILEVRNCSEGEYRKRSSVAIGFFFSFCQYKDILFAVTALHFHPGSVSQNSSNYYRLMGHSRLSLRDGFGPQNKGKGLV